MREWFWFDSLCVHCLCTPSSGTVMVLCMGTNFCILIGLSVYQIDHTVWRAVWELKIQSPSSKNYYEFSRWWESLLKSSALSSEELAWGWSHQAGELGQAGVIIAFSVLWRWEGDLFLSMKMILTWPRWFHPFQLCLKKKKAHNRKSYTRKLFVIHTCCNTVAVLGDLQSLNLYLIIESYSF